MRASFAEFKSGEQIDRATALKAFAAIAAVTFLLRIFYAGHLYEDDGLWLTAAEEILRGKALYREIYFDKPPGLALLYALLFKTFGAHIIVIRLFAILYSIAISVALYVFGSRFYGRRAGLLAAMLFAVFSTTNTSGHMQGLNTDFLMLLPYTAGAFLFARAAIEIAGERGARRKSAWLALAGGSLAGVAFQINPKAVFDLVFFAALLLLARGWIVRDAQAGATISDQDGAKVCNPQSAIRNPQSNNPQFTISRAAIVFALAIAGFLSSLLPALMYLAAERALSAYWLYVWDWGFRYARYYPASNTLITALAQSLSYFALNNTLLVALIFVVARTIRKAKSRPSPATAKSALGANFKAQSEFKSDVALLMWLAASYAGLAMGGRFYGHYFFQIIPALSLIAARGLIGIASSSVFRKASDEAGAASNRLRRAALAVLIVGFILTFVRFHTRTIILASDWARGAKSSVTAQWFYEKRNREERMAAAVVRGLDDGADAANRVGLEAMREGGPRARAASTPSDYLFIWGYRPEIYYWSGLLPASRYLSTQHLTGVPADVHYINGERRLIIDEKATAAARAELVRDLEQTQPAYIIDELGFFNSELAIQNYPELREFLKAYRNIGVTGRFFIYRKKDPNKKKRRNERKQG